MGVNRLCQQTPVNRACNLFFAASLSLFFYFTFLYKLTVDMLTKRLKPLRHKGLTCQQSCQHTRENLSTRYVKTGNSSLFSMIVKSNCSYGRSGLLTNGAAASVI